MGREIKSRFCARLHLPKQKRMQRFRETIPVSNAPAFAAMIEPLWN